MHLSAQAVSFQHLLSGAIPFKALVKPYLTDGHRLTRAEQIVDIFKVVHQINQVLQGANSDKDKEAWKRFISREICGLRFTPFAFQMNRPETSIPIRSDQLRITHLDFVHSFLKGKVERQYLQQLLESNQGFAVLAGAGIKALAISIGKRIPVGNGSILYLYINKAYSWDRYLTVNDILGPHEWGLNAEGIDGIVFLDILKPLSSFNHYASEEYSLLDSRPANHGQVILGLFYKSISNRDLPIEEVKKCFAERASQTVLKEEEPSKVLL